MVGTLVTCMVQRSWVDGSCAIDYATTYTVDRGRHRMRRGIHDQQFDRDTSNGGVVEEARTAAGPIQSKAVTALILLVECDQR